MRRREGPASQAALHHGSSSAQRPSGFLSIDQFRPDEEDKYPAWDVDVGVSNSFLVSSTSPGLCRSGRTKIRVMVSPNAILKESLAHYDLHCGRGLAKATAKEAISGMDSADSARLHRFPGCDRRRGFDLSGRGGADRPTQLSATRPARGCWWLQAPYQLHRPG